MLATTTKFPLLFSAILSITASAATASIPPINARSPQKCNVSYASSILKSLPTGRQFCSSLIYPFGIPTKTKTTTKVVVVTAKECTTKIETKVVHEVFTQTEFATTVLPSITVTQYASTVLIPSGPTPIINKRAPTAAPANQPKNPTPTFLATCDPQMLSCACSSLVYPCTKTKTQSSTSIAQCAITTIASSTAFDRGETTVTVPFTASPPKFVLTTSATLTTTVPAVCAGALYAPPGGPNPDGSQAFDVVYPDFPSTDVECCVYCAKLKNCIASYFDTATDSCEYLSHVSGQLPGVTAQCPLGIFDYNFGAPGAANGVLLPGPCGR